MLLDHKDDQHPGPIDDMYVSRSLTAEHSFGFKSEDMCRDWFAGFQRDMRLSGYVINVYDCSESDVVSSPFQSIFKKCAADLVFNIEL